MPLPRRVTNCHVYERVELNVYDTVTKQIIFTGTAMEIANKFKTTVSVAKYALISKAKYCKKYAIRTKSTAKQ